MNPAPGAPLALAFLIGMWHALDVDHVAAMASLLGDGGGARRAIRSGLAWGTGHALVLAAAGGGILVLRLGVPEATTLILEGLVGLMLAGLGLRAILLAARMRLHAHEHLHDGRHHAHWHAHVADRSKADTHGQHDAAPHLHPHSAGEVLRAILVGGMHGLAGSSGAALLALAAVPSVAGGIIFLILFGAGSIVGMGMVSLAVGAPLAVARRRYPPLYRWLSTSAGIASLVVGAILAWEAGAAGPLNW